LEQNVISNKKIIIESIPGASYHDGGRIKFGPDNYLYIATGDAGNEELAQDVNSLAGKILRVDENGNIPSDNPFSNAVYSYGHRNIQGIAWDSDGHLWATEHGRSGLQSGLDELNIIDKGKNYGWPEIQGGEKMEGMETPIIHSGSDETWAPAGAVFYEGSFYFTGLRGESLYKYNIQRKTIENFLIGKFGRLRTITYKDDFFYIATSNTDGRGTIRDGDDAIIKIPVSLRSN